ncbi:hypothetical protein BASA60_001527 [Batrachochytrium salamandrivorans]|nr:hypothetical protein BASA62_010407 [Batrachochytrium salamandrivorans]KAH6583255.1 hypothetical protein BASA60_001527 [Batrachochytrium salamandrivorans]KAH9274407.1 hypothetical protein BASA83_003037 [Batrachochytrium salamandrivorans]
MPQSNSTQLHLFRSLWGASPDSWDTLFPELKQKGFHGVEASILDTGFPNTDRFVSLLRQHNLVWICGLYTSWADYHGKWERLPVETHLQNFEAQIKHMQSIAEPPVHINCHSGSDSFTLAESVEFFTKAHKLQTTAFSLTIPLSHETHRGRSLYSPWIALEIAQAVPDILFTLDVSHWHVVSERMLEPSDIDVILRRTAHIHARIGTAQQPQIADPRDPESKDVVQAHQLLWSRAIAYQKDIPELTHRKYATLTPEYGPMEDGYMPCTAVYVSHETGQTKKTSMRELNELIIDEGHRLQEAL